MSNFNSQEYSWANVEITLLGRILTAVKGVRYKVSQNKEPIYGRGNKPLAIQRGNKSYEGEIKLLQSELEALTRASGKDNDIYDIPAFDIIVTYSKGGTIITDTLKGCEFTESEKEMNQEDTHMSERTLPFVCLDIKKGS